MNNKNIKTITTPFNCSFFLVILFSLTLLQTTIVKAEKGETKTLVSEKIINGKPATEGNWPWMAAIKTPGVSSFYGQFCGGTLIAPQWVITAAHCVQESEMEVLLGQNDLEGYGGETISVDKTVIHPKYDLDELTADIALLHLERPSSIEPVTLADTFNFQTEVGNNAMTLGWGKTSNSFFGSFPTLLQQADIKIQSNSICDQYINPTSENIICLNISNNIDTCYGDSGGPLLIFNQTAESWTQIGITSFGSEGECATNGAYAAYTQVDQYKQFIFSTINSSEEESPEEFLSKCVNKYEHYIGGKEGEAFFCGSLFDLRICQNTTGGSLNITQISIPEANQNEILEYYIKPLYQLREISYADLGYCE